MRRWSRCSRSPRSSRTVPSRFAICRSTSASASSSACSAPPAAASRRCCGSLPASAIPPPAQSTWPAAADGAGSRHQREIGFVFQEPTLMPWATAFNNVWLPLRLRGVSKTDARDQVMEALAHGRAGEVRRRLSARALRRHEDAGVDRPRPDHPAEAAVDGRALRRARRDHPLQAQRRSPPPVGDLRLDGGLRHPFGVRVGLSLQPHRGDGGAAGPGLRRSRRRRTLSARRGFPDLGGLQRILPARPPTRCIARSCRQWPSYDRDRGRAPRAA